MGKDLGTCDGHKQAKPVEALRRNNDIDLTHLTLRYLATRATLTIKTTQHHLFWDASAKKWVNAADLKSSTKRAGPDGELCRRLAPRAGRRQVCRVERERRLLPR